MGVGRKGQPMKTINPGQTVQLCDIEGPGTIRHIWLTTEPHPGTLRGMVLRAWWEGQKHASIECPIGDFFGTAQGKIMPYCSAVHSVSPAAGMNIWLPMPFTKRVKFELTNETNKPEPLFYQMTYTLGDKHADDVGRLHTLFRRENPTTPKKDFELLPLRKHTLIIVTAKHGQSPIDSSRYLGETGNPISTSPTEIADAVATGCVPFSESPSNANGIGPTQDDVSLVWLNQNVCSTETVVNAIERQSPSTDNVAGIGEIFSGRGITQLFNAPGIPPTGDPRTPDILVTPNIGVTYSGSGKKLAEHGGFSHDDTNVIMLLSNPGFAAHTVTSPVETEQVAPTVLAALGLDASKLDTVQLEGTQVLPEVSFGDSH